MEPTSLAKSLSQLVREGRWDDLEDAWTEHVLAGAALTPALEAVQAAATRREVQRCLPMVREHAEVLTGSERADEAVELLGTTMLLGGSPGELTKPLLENARAAWGEAPFWETYRALSGLEEGTTDIRGAWRKFRKLLALGDGRVVYHAAGWGLGKIESLDLGAGETKVRFTSGKVDRFPLQSAVDIFEVLEPGDLRELVVNDPDELERLLKREPLEVLRWVVQRNDGRAQHSAIKLALGTLGVDGSRFTAFWKRAQKQAEGSEWFEISGPPSRATVRLLPRAEDPAKSMKRQILRSRDLGEALTRVRALFTGSTSLGAEVRDAALEGLEELTAAGGPMPQRLAVWLFLREQRSETPEFLAAQIAKARSRPEPTDRSKPSALWKLFASVPGSREQERCIELLREDFGETWLDEVENSLQHAPPGMVRGLVEALEEDGRIDALARHYSSLLARPTRNPNLLVRLAERLEGREHEGVSAAPQQRAQCLLQLAVHLHEVTSANPVLTRTRMKLAALLTSGRPPLLRRLLDGSDTESLRALARLIEKGVERTVDRLFMQVAIEMSPDIFRSESDRAFWLSSHIWTTRAGMVARQEELRILRDVKIPENAEAIGRAASYGDLSENAEWSAAIEEQRNLTTRAMELEKELENARLIENAILPVDVAAPGTRVEYRELPGGELRSIDILGPWDADGEQRISYRSPLANPMLGNEPGDEVDITLPGSTIRVRIESVRPIVF